MNRTATVSVVAAAIAVLVTAALASASAPLHAARFQTTSLISRSVSGGTPNGASSDPVISGDRRYARIIAFESEASNLVNGDTNQQKDVFAIKRGGSFGNDGSQGKPGKTTLVSRGRNGSPANEPAFAPDAVG